MQTYKLAIDVIKTVGSRNEPVFDVNVIYVITLMYTHIIQTKKFFKVKNI